MAVVGCWSTAFSGAMSVRQHLGLGFLERQAQGPVVFWTRVFRMLQKASEWCRRTPCVMHKVISELLTSDLFALEGVDLRYHE